MLAWPWPLDSHAATHAISAFESGFDINPLAVYDANGHVMLPGSYSSICGSLVGLHFSLVQSSSSPTNTMELDVVVRRLDVFGSPTLTLRVPPVLRQTDIRSLLRAVKKPSDKKRRVAEYSTSRQTRPRKISAISEQTTSNVSATASDSGMDCT